MIDEIYNCRQSAINSYHFSDKWEKLASVTVLILTGTLTIIVFTINVKL